MKVTNIIKLMQIDFQHFIWIAGGGGIRSDEFIQSTLEQREMQTDSSRT